MAKNYTVVADHLEEIAAREWMGPYDFRCRLAVYRITAGPLAPGYATQYTGFRWRGNEGGSATDWHLADLRTATELAARLERETAETLECVELYAAAVSRLPTPATLHVKD